MSLEPTPEQRAAIEHALADACVVAGAGSGKTAVLSRRFVHLALAHRLPVRRIAALTYTDKAAGEMRLRIARDLAEAGRPDLAAEVEFAPISTIHAFAARLLRRHAIDAGLDPAFRVLDETESRLLREDAWRLGLADLFAGDPETLAVLSRVPAGKDECLFLLERVRGAGIDPGDLTWRYGDGGAPPEPEELLGALDDLEREAADADATTRARVASAGAEVRRALAAPADAWHVLAARDAVAAAKPDPPRRGSARLRDARCTLTDQLDVVLGRALDEIGAREVLPSLRRLLARVDRAYSDLKRGLSGLDFTDLERGAFDLLGRLAAEGRAPANAPRALLIDEMQDTNPLQARILARLGGVGCPRFSVGDPKQSIYRFRRADVRVLEAERARVGVDGGHVLSRTFRARPPLVDALNELTARLFEGGAAGVPAAALVAAGRFDDVEGPDVELTIVDAGAGADADSRRAAEARYVARRIKELVEVGTPRARRVPGEPRRMLGYGDVAILLRARSDLSVYEEALLAEAIPFVTHRGRGFFQADEIVDLVYALRVVHDPADDFAFLCFATGPALAATDDDLLRWFEDPRASPREPGAPWARFGEAADSDARLARVRDAVERLRWEAVAGRLGRVVEGALYDLGLLESQLLRPGGARRAMNLRKAVALARRVERRGGRDLAGLLRHLETVRDLEVAEAEAPVATEGVGAVRLNTVHGAKGLEFPVVVIADVGRKSLPVKDALLFDGERSLAAKLRHPLEGTGHRPAGWQAAKDHETRLVAEEDRRLLYVAMTRAEERLFVTGSSAGLTRDGRPKGLQGWGAALLEALQVKPEREPGEVRLGSGRLVHRRVDPVADAPSPPLLIAVSAPGASARAEARRLREEAARPIDVLGGTPFVASVSDLLHFERSPARFYLRRLEPRAEAPPRAAEPDDPASGDERGPSDEVRRADRRWRFDELGPEREAVEGGAGRVDRAAIGRALHAVLEHLRPSRAGPSADQVREALVDQVEGEPSPDAVALVSAMVERFRASSIGRRVAAALREGEDIRREVAFHARIRFPRGAEVGGFDALLVRGAIDLWLPTAEGLLLVDYKTNPPSDLLPTPAAVREQYAVQIAFYALAAERLLGHDVAGARLLLLDPGWGDPAVEVEMDVGGEALEDARRLASAYAVASLRDRWPGAWRDLLVARG